MGMRRAFLISCILSVGCFKIPTQELLVVVEGMCVGSRVRGMIWDEPLTADYLPVESLYVHFRD